MAIMRRSGTSHQIVLASHLLIILASHPSIILASRSPRRKAALRRIITSFSTLAVTEPRRAKGRTITQKTCYLANAKAKTASRRFPSSIIIAADTLASCKGKVLGKPTDKHAAKQMLDLLSGSKMEAVTSIALYSPKTRRINVWSERGWVRFRALEEDEKKRYLASRKWVGKAAAVNVEEKPVRDWIAAREGDIEAVIGLPTSRLRQEIKKCYGDEIEKCHD